MSRVDLKGPGTKLSGCHIAYIDESTWATEGQIASIADSRRESRMQENNVILKDSKLREASLWLETPRSRCAHSCRRQNISVHHEQNFSVSRQCCEIMNTIRWRRLSNNSQRLLAIPGSSSRLLQPRAHLAAEKCHRSARPTFFLHHVPRLLSVRKLSCQLSRHKIPKMEMHPPTQDLPPLARVSDRLM